MTTLQSISNISYCYDYVVNQISVDLLLYAHIPPAIVALGFGFFIIYKNRSIAGSSLFYVCVCFALWSFLNLITWFVFVGAADTMFAWSLIDLVGLVFFFFSYRFLYAYITENDLPTKYLLLCLMLITPTLITTLLGYNLLGFDMSICEAIENENVVFYTYFAQGVFILASLILGIIAYRNTTLLQRKKEIVLATSGIVVFLSFFFLINFLVLILINYTAVEYAYNFGIYGLFAMPILLIFLGYLIVKFRAFRIYFLATEALIVALVVVVGSMYFFAESITSTILITVSLILVTIGGIFLIKSVRREVDLRNQITELADNLQNANIRLKELDKMKSEFVSIASHQLRSPLTSIRGYASMLQEGSYGKLPVKAQEVIGKIADSSKYMALSVEDYLNVSRIEAGNMKYELSDFNLRDVAEKIVDELRPIALKKGLVMVFRSDCNGSCMTHADIGKTRQIIMNLLDNSMKYTPKGMITLVVHDNIKKKKVLVTIQDTGVGMSKETIEGLFDKFVRAKNANHVNVTGTGLGLFVARKMATDMGARIWAESEGEGKGSTFHVEFDLLPGKPKKEV